MRPPIFVSHVIPALALAAAMLLPGCSAGEPQTFAPAFDFARSGVAPKYLAYLQAHPTRNRRAMRLNHADLYVDDSTANDVALFLNGYWSRAGILSAGIDGPDGNWFASGKLYVANFAGDDVTEYSSPKVAFTYDSGMVDPVGVTTDSAENVYEADYDFPINDGFVNEYAQGSNTVVATCHPGGGAEGVAVDRRGDVFVTFNTGSEGLIEEYPRGLAGCKGKLLPVTFGFAGGVTIDKQKNLIVCDQFNASVDIVAPPYTSITGTLGSGYADPFHVTIDKANDQAYVADLSAAAVYIVNYPSGTNVATLNSSNGLSNPSSAVDADNYTP
jgi:hypothetical protein